MDNRSFYAVIDPVIISWCSEHELKLCTEFGGEERRFAYITGGPQECFQISIEPQDKNKVVVNAWSIETIDDAELHDFWICEISELEAALISAWIKINAWSARAKGPPTWAPPKSWSESD